jgi:hypothetical protein
MNRPVRVGICLVLAAIAVTALPHLGTAPLDAQSPPRPPHLYYGDGDAESAAQIDGAAAPEGTLIIARDAAQNEVGRTAVTQTHWLIQISEEDADTVSFEFLGCAGRTQSFPVESGGLTAVRLEASGCQPAIDRAALGAAQAVAEESSTDPAVAEEDEARIEELERESDAEEAAAATDPPRDTGSQRPTPVGAGGGDGDAWIWILLGVLVAAIVIGGLYWVRRPVDRAR